MNVPESKVEVTGFEARHYDRLLKFGSFGKYNRMLKTAIVDMNIQADDAILDLGCGTGYNDCLMAEYLNQDGKIVGLEIGEQMIAQFQKKCGDRPNISLLQHRIEESLPFNSEFDKAFISFVFHGFPDSEREKIARNVLKALKPGGEFFIFDFNEFDVQKQPWLFRTIFLKGAPAPAAFCSSSRRRRILQVSALIRLQRRVRLRILKLDNWLLKRSIR